MNGTKSTLDISGLTRRVRADGADRIIVDNFSFTFDCSRPYNIVGPSGAGKSSLLRLLNRLDEPSSGDIIFNDTNTRDIPPQQLRRRIGYLFQTPYMFPGTISDNIREAEPTLSEEAIAELLKSTGLNSDYIRKETESLSGGEKQRVAMARLLACSPSVILLDEPTASLDPTATRGIEELVKRVASDQCLIALIVTHEPAQAVRMGGETLLLVKGRLIEHGDSEQVIANPTTPEGRAYRDRELV